MPPKTPSTQYIMKYEHVKTTTLMHAWSSHTYTCTQKRTRRPNACMRQSHVHMHARMHVYSTRRNTHAQAQVLSLHVHAHTYTTKVVPAQGLNSCCACVKFCLTYFFPLPTDRWDPQSTCQFNQSTKCYIDYLAGQQSSIRCSTVS